MPQRVLRGCPARLLLFQPTLAFCIGRILFVLCVLCFAVLAILLGLVLAVLLCLILAVLLSFVSMSAVLVFVRRIVLVIQDTHLLTRSSMNREIKNIRRE